LEAPIASALAAMRSSPAATANQANAHSTSPTSRHDTPNGNVLRRQATRQDRNVCLCHAAVAKGVAAPDDTHTLPPRLRGFGRQLPIVASSDFGATEGKRV